MQMFAVINNIDIVFRPSVWDLIALTNRHLLQSLLCLLYSHTAQLPHIVQYCPSSSVHHWRALV